MPRLRNTRTGTVVNVDDVTAARLGDQWEAVETAEKADSKKSAPRRKASTTKSDDE